MENISLEQFEAELLVQPADARLTVEEIKIRDMVNAAIKELGLDEDEDGEEISALFKKFAKEAEKKGEQKMTNKEMAAIIKDEWAGVPEKQIEVGRYLHKVGRNYVYVLDIHGSTTIEKWPIDVFFAHYVELVRDDRDLDYLIRNEVNYNYSGKC